MWVVRLDGNFVSSVSSTFCLFYWVILACADCVLGEQTDGEQTKCVTNDVQLQPHNEFTPGSYPLGHRAMLRIPEIEAGLVRLRYQLPVPHPKLILFFENPLHSNLLNE